MAINDNNNNIKRDILKVRTRKGKLKKTKSWRKKTHIIKKRIILKVRTRKNENSEKASSSVRAEKSQRGRKKFCDKNQLL